MQQIDIAIQEFSYSKTNFYWPTTAWLLENPGCLWGGYVYTPASKPVAIYVDVVFVPVAECFQFF